MTELPNLVLPLLVGCMLGAIFFGGLWWTVRLGLVSPWPGVWFLGSFVLRTAISLAGFYLVGHNDWHRLMACLLGFVVARVAITWLTRAPLRIEMKPVKEPEFESHFRSTDILASRFFQFE